MTTSKEAAALIIAARVHLQHYKNANAALKATKAALETYMDDLDIDNVDGDEQGSGARFVTRQERTLLIEGMTDELIIWCAREGLLKGSITALDELPDAQRATLQPHVGIGEGPRYVDIYFPAWGTARQAKKESARAASTATPTPIRQAPQPAPAAVPSALCPVHGKAKHSEKSGGLFCPSKMDDGGWCKWTTARQAS